MSLESVTFLAMLLAEPARHSAKRKVGACAWRREGGPRGEAVPEASPRIADYWEQNVEESRKNRSSSLTLALPDSVLVVEIVNRV